MLRKELFGEFLGTFILVFIGCGSIALNLFFDMLINLYQVAIVWGIGVSLAIFTTRKICPAHLNPAVSIALFFAKKIEFKKVPFYVVAQFLGAFFAASLLYFFLSDTILAFELKNSIVRGEIQSVKTAQMFGEFFPNHGYVDTISVNGFEATLFEGFGTFLLVFVILLLIRKPVKKNWIPPILIGLTVTLIIILIAPYTQAGLNPARDFGPRLFAFFAGWGNIAFPQPSLSFFYVYIVGPILGGLLAVYLSRFIKLNPS